MENITKKCPKCGRELSLECFGKCKSSKDGLQSYCKECKKQYDADNAEYFKQYRADNAEYFKQYNKQWRADNAEARKQYFKQYYTEYADAIKQYMKHRYATIEGYARSIRNGNLREDRKYGRIGADEDPLPSLEYYMWVLQQPDFYDEKHYPFTEMGLDRIYNDKPHTFANVVPCSTTNNRRRHLMPFEEFVELIRKEKEEGLELVL